MIYTIYTGGRALGIVVMAAWVSACSQGGVVEDGEVSQAFTVVQSAVTTAFGNHAMQSETSIAVGATSTGTQTMVVAYNDETDPTHITYPDNLSRSIIAGASLMGWAYSLDGASTWTTKRLTPPANFDVLWGDPSVTVLPNSKSTLFMANLASPSNINWSQGSDSPYTPGICVAKSVDGGQSFSIYQCVTLSNPVPSVTNDCDGTSIAADTGGRVMTACWKYLNSDGQYGAFWMASSPTGAFSAIGNPFTCAVSSHILLRAYGGTFYAVAQCGSGYYASRYTTSWSTPVLVSPTTNMVSSVSVGFQTKGTVRALASDFGVGDPNTNYNDQFRIFYTQRSGSGGKYWVAGTYCAADLTGCASPGYWSTQSSTGDQFMPAVGIANPFPTTVPGGLTVTFWTRANNPTGDQSQVVAFLPSPGGLSVGSLYGVTALQTVCPTNKTHYWGDYNDIKYLGLSGRQPEFVSTYTDSSAGCTTQWDYTSTHQHVSAVVHYD